MVKIMGGVLCIVSVILLIVTFIVDEPQKSWLSFKNPFNQYYLRKYWCFFNV